MGIRIVIVDDSSFSIAFLKDILEDNGFEVVGQAGNLEEVKQVIADKKPDLVTMDMTLPGTNGLECTRAVHEIDGNIKVIVVSSMMDDEIVKEAMDNKVSAYVQKPVDADELLTAINRVMAVDELYEFLEKEYFSVFKESLMDGLNRMTKTLLTYKDEYSSDKEYESEGMTILIGIIGKFSGRMLIDLSKETANNLAAAILRRDPKDNDEMMAALGEFTNIISGNACSVLNRKNKALGLRVAPPSILRGDSVLISSPSFNTTTAIAETNYGKLLLNVGFKRGEEKWT
jgi:Response regulator containing a CheY-like receiver domain and an HTH DNA-binding domain